MYGQEKIAKRDEAIKVLREAVVDMMGARKAFVEECMQLEGRLRGQLAQARDGARAAAAGKQRLEQDSAGLMQQADALMAKLRAAEAERCVYGLWWEVGGAVYVCGG